MLCRHPARTRRRCHTDRPPARLAEGQADAAPPVAPVQQATPVQQIIRQIKTVLIEVPLAAAKPERTNVAAVVDQFVKLAPWARNKLAELATGAAGSVLGSGIAAGVKFGLGL